MNCVKDGRSVRTRLLLLLLGADGVEETDGVEIWLVFRDTPICVTTTLLLPSDMTMLGWGSPSPSMEENCNELALEAGSCGCNNGGSIAEVAGVNDLLLSLCGVVGTGDFANVLACCGCAVTSFRFTTGRKAGPVDDDGTGGILETFS